MEKFVVNGKYFNYWIDDSYYKPDKFGKSGGRIFKKFFKQFCKNCFKINVDIACFCKSYEDFPLVSREKTAYASICASVESIKDYHIISELFFKKAENNSAEQYDKQNNEQNDKNKRFVDFFIFNKENKGFEAMVEVKRIYKNIYGNKEQTQNCEVLIKNCIKQTKWYVKNYKTLFVNDEKAKGDKNERLCLALFLAPIFCKEKKAKDSLNDDAKNAINDLNKAILNIGEEELKDSNIKSGLIAGVLDCSNVFLNNSLWDGEIITHAYIGALVLK